MTSPIFAFSIPRELTTPPLQNVPSEAPAIEELINKAASPRVESSPKTPKRTMWDGLPPASPIIDRKSLERVQSKPKKIAPPIDLEFQKLIEESAKEVFTSPPPSTPPRSLLSGLLSPIRSPDQGDTRSGSGSPRS